MRNRKSGRVGLVILGAVAGVAAVTLLPLPPEQGIARAADEATAKPYKVDKVHSSIIFGVKHLGVGYVYGRFNMMSGQFFIDPTSPKESSAEITVNVESIDTGDEGRDKHLRGTDFFDVKVFPTATFKSASFKHNGEQLEMTGDLTMHGITKRVTVPVEFVGAGKDPWGNARAGFHAEFTINRSDFGINYMPEGLGDEVRMIVAIEGVQR